MAIKKLITNLSLFSLCFYCHAAVAEFNKNDNDNKIFKIKKDHNRPENKNHPSITLDRAQNYDGYHSLAYRSTIEGVDPFVEPTCKVGSKCENIPVTPFDPTDPQAKHWSDEEETSEHWYNVAKNEIDMTEHKMYSKINRNKAKYAIIFLGDGMGVPTVTAGRIFRGQEDAG